MPRPSRAPAIRQFLLDNIPAHPSNVVAVAMAHFGLSRTAIIRYLTQLQQEGVVAKSGRTHDSRYTLAASAQVSKRYRLPETSDESLVWQEDFAPFVASCPESVRRILEYAFTEMFNNAIDHSGARRVDVSAWSDTRSIRIMVHDDGVGIFKKIQQALGLPDERESILHLSKGKLTTDPTRHTGEGIFFSSRTVDLFRLASGHLEFVRDGREEDWFIETRQGEGWKGTLVTFEISKQSDRDLTRIFAQYTNDDSGFSKTHLHVKLAALEEESYISRSQAKRLLAGLEEFQHIVFDFKKVRTVGQGFVDEVFRVYANSHPGVILETRNMNDDVKFMVERSLK